MIYDCKNVALTQAEIDAVIAALESRADVGRHRVSCVATDSALQKFLAVERRELAPKVPQC